MPDNIIENLANAFTHPVTVQVINQSPGIWRNVATGLITGLLTGGITLTDAPVRLVHPHVRSNPWDEWKPSNAQPAAVRPEDLRKKFSVADLRQVVFTQNGQFRLSRVGGYYG